MLCNKFWASSTDAAVAPIYAAAAMIVFCLSSSFGGESNLNLWPLASTFLPFRWLEPDLCLSL